MPCCWTSKGGLSKPYLFGRSSPASSSACAGLAAVSSSHMRLFVTLPIVESKSCTLLDYVVPHCLDECCAAASAAAHHCMLPVLASFTGSAPSCSPVSR